MDLLLLALVQGLTEVLPISSTGHLGLVRQILHSENFNLGSAVALHSASALAIILWFWRDIVSLVQRFRDSLWTYIQTVLEGKNPFFAPSETRVPYYMALSMIPLSIEALIFRNWAETVFTDERAIPLFLMVTGLVIFLTARFTRGGRSLAEMGWRDYLIVGAVQGIAVLPGVSRLGMVLCMGLWLKLSWPETLRLGFLQAIPVIIGAVAVQFPEISAIFAEKQIAVWLLALTIVLASSWLGLKMITSALLERRSFIFFGYYCLLLGGFAFIFQLVW